MRYTVGASFIPQENSLVFSRFPRTLQKSPNWKTFVKFDQSSTFPSFLSEVEYRVSGAVCTQKHFEVGERPKGASR